MGLFRRRRSDDGLYTGDAPVSQPGWEGEAPSAYQSARSRPAPAPGPTGGRPRLRAETIGWLSVLGVGAVLLVGYAGYTILTATQAAIPPAEQTASPAQAAAAVVDVPVTVSYRGQDIRIVVGDAQQQPAAGWGLPSSTADPQLVIPVTMEHLDADETPITIPFFDWSFTPAGGQESVPVNLISGFEPAIGSPTLRPGAAVSGFLAFQTPVTDGTLTLQPLLTPTPLARWSISAGTAAVVPGVIGEPVRAQVGVPPFTMTLNAAARLGPGADSVQQDPTTGGYLVADLTVTADSQRPSGIIDPQSFVFVPSGGSPVSPVGPGAVTGTTSIGSFASGSGSGTPIVLAFDVPAGPGTLELRNRAGDPMIAWLIP